MLVYPHIHVLPNKPRRFRQCLLGYINCHRHVNFNTIGAGRRMRVLRPTPPVAHRHNWQLWKYIEDAKRCLRRQKAARRVRSFRTPFQMHMGELAALFGMSFDDEKFWTGPHVENAKRLIYYLASDSWHGMHVLYRRHYGLLAKHHNMQEFQNLVEEAVRLRLPAKHPALTSQQAFKFWYRSACETIHTWPEWWCCPVEESKTNDQIN